MRNQNVWSKMQIVIHQTYWNPG